MKTFSRGIALLGSLLLAGCVSDAASFQIDGKELSISVVREQKWIWESRAELFVVVTRMPDCQRRHALKSAEIKDTKVEVYSPDGETYYLQQGDMFYMVEVNTCEEFQELTTQPVGGVGEKMGRFIEQNGQYSFVVESSAQQR